MRLKHANELHNLLLKLRHEGLGYKEHHISGMMEILGYASEYLLREYGFATKWFMKKMELSSLLPLRLQALDLCDREIEYIPKSNPLGGYRV